MKPFSTVRYSPQRYLKKIERFTSQFSETTLIVMMVAVMAVVVSLAIFLFMLCEGKGSGEGEEAPGTPGAGADSPKKVAASPRKSKDE
jgi:hypothetical protein